MSRLTKQYEDTKRYYSTHSCDEVLQKLGKLEDKEEQNISNACEELKSSVKKLAQHIKEQKEQKIFKKFFKIGFSTHYSEDNEFLLDLINSKEMSIIKIDKKGKRYIKVDYITFNEFIPITLKEHQLLHELFELWEWFE